MKIPKIEDCGLRKVSIQRNGGLEIVFSIPIVEGESEKINEIKVKKNDLPHADFNELMVDFKEPTRVILESSFENIRITTIEAGGDYCNESIKLVGNLNHITEQKTKFTTPYIKFNDNAFDVEGRLWTIFECLKVEAYDYAFNDKFGQLSLFNNADQEDEPEDSDTEQE